MSATAALRGEGVGEALAGRGQAPGVRLAAAAGLAMATAPASATSQRRTAIAGLRLCGVSDSRLRRIMLTEPALMLGTGCLTGAAMSVYGQAIIDVYLRKVTGFPVAAIPAEVRPLAIFGLVVVIAVSLAAKLLVDSLPPKHVPDRRRFPRIESNPASG